MKTIKGIFIMAVALVILGGSIVSASALEWVWDDP